MVTYKNKQFTKEQIVAIATTQKELVGLFPPFVIFPLAKLAMHFKSSLKINEDELMNCIGSIVLLILEIVSIVFVIKMSIALKFKTIWVVILTLLSFIPPIGLIIAIIVNEKVKEVLRKAGLKAGFWGASSDAIKQWEESH
ncbi:MAG: hypothetical protein J6Y92_11550 [Lentisphaeria bacterium]|nr:hypothetical protein [Lentisphaeria bacterium]